jgi:hypothetical protein
MSSEYPDILNDLVKARQRFEVNGVHYVMALDPEVVAPGEATALHAWLQSCWDVPVQVSLSVHLPRSAEGFAVVQQTTDIPLEPAEVGEVTIPIAAGAGVEPGQYSIAITVGVKFETRGLYVRSQQSEGQLKDSLLNTTRGMRLAATVGLGYTARTQPRQELTLHVEGPAQPGPDPDLTPTYLSHWTVDELPIQGKAIRNVNEQSLYILPKLTRQALYVAFLEESQDRLRDAELPLQLGEALFLAKILTFTVEYFLKRSEWQDAILVPAFYLAYRYDLNVDDPVMLVARADYARITRLAISLSFGMLRRRLGQDVWTMEEQEAVADLVADRVERGGPLPVEFVYLPLLLGGLMVADKVQMPGEKLAQSVALLAQARQQRSDALAEIPELVQLLDQLLKASARSA